MKTQGDLSFPFTGLADALSGPVVTYPGHKEAPQSWVWFQRCAFLAKFVTNSRKYRRVAILPAGPKSRCCNDPSNADFERQRQQQRRDHEFIRLA
uniref:Uncharacterized protein n=1 Tax=Vespula pensylvanica TaxID=30213 RepID=A0A834P189_VESPE|nr:hypothetical protein H0235_009182 [Vespula pensylvanica]